jgi:hypothetical protein
VRLDHITPKQLCLSDVHAIDVTKTLLQISNLVL